ncbi:MAG TPA: methyltransferase domain-containing protein [Euzebya sp.]|nr:methyltransferase domain-containing protein [Euzebya sp.]
MNVSGLIVRGRRLLIGHVSATRRKRWRRTVRRARWGNLRRLQPLSGRFGFDRGTPIDRHHTDLFMAANADAIRGVVGEIAEDTYASRVGGTGPQRIEIIDIDPANTRATIVADLAQEGALAAGGFDCLIITQTLQYVSDPEAALGTCAAALRPGGVLLLAVPALTPHDDIEPHDIDRWRFWPAGLRQLLHATFPEADVRVHSAGNLTTALAFLHGMAAEELRPAELDHVDPRFPVVVLARVDRG